MLYLLRSFMRKGSMLKLGYASDVSFRHAQYESHNPGVELISSRGGSLETEELLHIYLHFLGYGKYKDEWYVDCPEVEYLFHENIEKVKKQIWKKSRQNISIWLVYRSA